MNTLAGDGEFARNTKRFRKNQTTPNLMIPYSTAPVNTGAYTLAQSLVEEPINPLDFYQSPDALTSASNALSYTQMGSKLLSTKFGDSTLGSKIFGKGFGSTAGATMSNPFTTSASVNSFIPKTGASQIMGAGAPAGSTAIFNPTTGQSAVLLPGEAMPTGFEAAGTTAGATASNYFTNLSQGSVSAGVPTYIAGRLIRSAFDDDDPTTFSAGEMLGAGVSGAGAGSALAGMLGIGGPLGLVAGIAISLFGGKKKRDKARRLQQEYEKMLADREAEVRGLYDEEIQSRRKDLSAQAAEKQYMETASQFNNPYGAGNMAKGGKMPDQYFLGGLVSSIASGIQNIASGAGDIVETIMGAGADAVETIVDAGGEILDVSLETGTDILETAGAVPMEILDTAGETVIQPVMDKVGKPILQTAGNFVSAGGDLLFQGIETGLEVGGDLLTLGLEAGADAFGAVAGVPIGIMQGIDDALSGDDPELPELPPLPTNMFAGKGVEAPIRTQIDPYGNPIRGIGGLDPSLVSGSAGFIRPNESVKTNIYSETQENV
jgi:hypothetical protein